MKKVTLLISHGRPIESFDAWETYLILTEELFLSFEQILKIPEIRDSSYI